MRYSLTWVRIESGRVPAMVHKLCGSGDWEFPNAVVQVSETHTAYGLLCSVKQR